MRELGKLTAEDMEALEHPVPVTNHGRPVAWLVPMDAGERRRAELIAAGRLRPATVPEALRRRRPLPSRPDGASLSEALVEMRESEGR
ncbi:type II toxin-antitoxin system Phd/YefM family antitoxin [Streptomyces sp. A7024]|uniref:Type II toxin-antitoxin system Phd/YefM family antitoxin n=1 Tax=Streptomyces coryli TaxID=1128680 RepID=A0A6G4UCA4_9ACTN|nr:type II toxin-antitoxin system Phd/YefM family antitoxin [Streptomyces coryli]NGN69306.1 type II toxin-antitoxin system Phd/YefM family antitoxin [Streptomyces coryli]